MPLLRQSLYSQNVNLYLAPTADGRDTWLPLMRTVACEGRCVVLSANQCVKKGELPGWYEGDGVGGVVERNYNGAGHGRQERRKSLVVENGHEIALPDDSPKKNGSPNIPRTRRRSTIIEGGHEIVLPNTASDEVITEEEPTPSSTTQNRNTCNAKSSLATNNTTTEEYASHGGSCIISPTGAILAGPLWNDSTSLLTVDVDFEDCIRGRLDLDVGGSYSRYVSFTLLCWVLVTDARAQE